MNTLLHTLIDLPAKFSSVTVKVIVLELMRCLSGLTADYMI